MELVIYFDSELENRQRVSTQRDCRVKPSEFASTVYPNYYAVTKDGGGLMKNPHHNSDTTMPSQGEALADYDEVETSAT